MPTKKPTKRTARIVPAKAETKRRAAIEKRPRAATLVTGGTIEDPKESAPDGAVVKVLNGPSTGGGVIQNGVSRKVGPGDVVIIPPNTPHWFSEISSDQIVYLVVRVDPHKVLPAGYGAR